MPKTPLTPEELAAKAAAKVAKKAAEGAISAMAASYGLVPAEKRALLKQADRLHLTEQAAEVVLTRLVPKALAVWEQALDSGNVDVATRVLEGAAIVGRIMEWKRPEAAAEVGTLDFELVRETIIGRIATGQAGAAAAGGHDRDAAAGDGWGHPTPATIDAEILRPGGGSGGGDPAPGDGIPPTNA